jgi:hypothetical protein
MTSAAPKIETQLALVFAPLDKRALGLGVGSAFAVFIAVLSTASAIVDPQQRFPIMLLRQYFFGFDVTVLGILVGSAWAFVTGFLWGWFAAFTRNLVYALWLMILRIRTDFATSRDFLDHI